MVDDVSEPIRLSLPLVPLIAAVLYAPGHVVAFMISRFTTGRPNFLGSVSLSVLYYVIIWSVLSLFFDVDSIDRLMKYVRKMNFRDAFFCVVMGPVFLGTVFGIVTQKRWIYRLAREGLYWLSRGKFSLNPVHGIPAAWDWAFGLAGTRWITIYLEDGSKIIALYDAKSFISTDPNERDIYVHEIKKWTNKWGNSVKISSVDGILLTGNSIRKIVFHSKPEKESNDDGT